MRATPAGSRLVVSPARCPAPRKGSGSPGFLAVRQRSRRFLTAAETPETVSAAVRGLHHASVRARSLDGAWIDVARHPVMPGKAPEFDSNCATSRRRQVTLRAQGCGNDGVRLTGGCDEKDRNTVVGLYGVRRDGSGLGAIVVAGLGQLPSTTKSSRSARKAPLRRQRSRRALRKRAPGSTGRCRWKWLRPTRRAKWIQDGDRADVGSGHAGSACLRTAATARRRATSQERPVPWCAERQRQGV